MRLVLGDDHRMFLEALRGGLELRGHDVVAASDHLDGLPDLVERHRPDLCILDVDFGGRSVLGAVTRIRCRLPGTALVLLSGAATAEVWRAYDARVVDGVVNKLCDIRVLNRAIERVQAGERVVERFARAIPRQREPLAESVGLSRQERAVASYLARGASTEQMAAELGVSIHTVRSHVQSVLRKLGVNSRAKAAHLAAAMAGVEPASGRVVR